MSTDAHATALANLFPQLIPEMILAATACFLFLGGTWKTNRALWAGFSLAGLAAAAIVLWLREPIAVTPLTTYGTPLTFDPLTNMIRWIALATGALLTVFGWSEVPERYAGEFFACLLLIIAGMGLTAAANDLVLMFLALELVSIPTYVLLYLSRRDAPAQEAAMKYFMLSIFSSALMLFGFSYLYGLAGTTNISALQHTLNVAAEPGQVPQVPVLSLVALVMVVAGLGFRITAVPFHFYAPDVYQGTSTVGAGMLAFVPKVVGFVALIRLLGFVLPPDISQEITRRRGLIGVGLYEQVPVLFWFLAVVSMFLGNVLALLQDNVKRLLAYSSVAHAGYMLMALATAPYLFLRHDARTPDGTMALLFYLVAYGAMTIGAFAVLSYLGTAEQSVESVDDLAGLAISRPGVAFVMAIFLFSLIGIPLTAGFAGKFLIFFGAMDVPKPEYATLFYVLALLGVLNAAIGGWYYLRVLAVMYLRQPLYPHEGRKSWPGLATLWICAALTVGFGIWPGADWLMHAAQDATQMKSK